MRDTLDHLPAAKQRELAHVVRVLFEEFAEATARATQAWKKKGRILKVVLYGSYARGDWVDDPIGGYQSDYDILVVVSDDRDFAGQLGDGDRIAVAPAPPASAADGRGADLEAVRMPLQS